MRKTISIWAVLASLFAGSISVADTTTGTDANDVILAGHDAVAYFTQN